MTRRLVDIIIQVERRRPEIVGPRLDNWPVN